MINKKAKILSTPRMLLFLFISFFKVALFIVGGGLAMIPMIEHIFVREKKLLKEEDMLDMIAIMQTMPGMMAVNAAIFVGHKLAGFKGAAVSIIGVITPSVLIIMAIAAIFQNLDIQNPHILSVFSCVRACTVAIFLSTACKLISNVFHEIFDYVVVALFIIALFSGVPQMILILTSIPVGWGYVLYKRFVIRGQK